MPFTVHTSSYHGSIFHLPAMYTHVSMQYQCAHCFRLPWLTNLMYTILTVEIQHIPVCSRCFGPLCVKISVKTPLSTTSLTRWHQSPDPDPPSLPMGRSSTLPSASNTPLSPPPTPRAHPCIAIYPRSVRMQVWVYIWNKLLTFPAPTEWIQCIENEPGPKGSPQCSFTVQSSLQYTVKTVDCIHCSIFSVEYHVKLTQFSASNVRDHYIVCGVQCLISCAEWYGAI